MKTFFIALILGILIGCLATTYHFSPDTFEGITPQESPKTTEDTPAPEEAISPPITEQAEEIFETTEDSVEEDSKGIVEKGEDLAQSLKEKGSNALESTRDLTIGTTIRSKFKLDREIDSSAISIDVNNGRVTLSGPVPTKEIKQRIISLAVETKWVKEVESKLQIK